MLVKKYPRLSGSRIQELGALRIVFVDSIPRASFCVAGADAGLMRK